MLTSRNSFDINRRLDDALRESRHRSKRMCPCRIKSFRWNWLATLHTRSSVGIGTQQSLWGNGKWLVCSSHVARRQHFKALHELHTMWTVRRVRSGGAGIQARSSAGIWARRNALLDSLSRWSFEQRARPVDRFGPSLPPSVGSCYSYIQNRHLLVRRRVSSVSSSMTSCRRGMGCVVAGGTHARLCKKGRRVFRQINYRWIMIHCKGI